MPEEGVKLKEFEKPSEGSYRGVASAVIHDGMEFIIMAPTREKLDQVMDSYKILMDGLRNPDRFKDVLLIADQKGQVSNEE